MNPYFSRKGVAIYKGDCRELLAHGHPDVRLVVTDPPYMFGMASTMHEGKAGSWADMMNAASFYADNLRVLREVVTPRQGAAWVFNSWRSVPVLMRAAFEAQWGIESLLVWDKEWIGPGGSRGLRPSYEVVALFAAEGFALQNRGLPDIWRSKWPAGWRKTGHPAEKPVALLEKLITESGEGDVLDPFMGSGSTLVAAYRRGRGAVGIEMEERYCEMAARRLEKEMENTQ